MLPIREPMLHGVRQPSPDSPTPPRRVDDELIEDAKPLLSENRELRRRSKTTESDADDVTRAGHKDSGVFAVQEVREAGFRSRLNVRRLEHPGQAIAMELVDGVAQAARLSIVIGACAADDGFVGVEHARASLLLSAHRQRRSAAWLRA